MRRFEDLEATFTRTYRRYEGEIEALRTELESTRALKG
jgi:hypothetical protein